MSEILFSSNRLRAELHVSSLSKVVITFPPRQPRLKGFLSGEHAFFLKKRGLSQIAISTSQNDWYLNPDLPALIATIQPAANRFETVICFGFSMGGYAAMLFSGAVNANRVIAVSPQFSPDPIKTPFEYRWMADRKKIDVHHDDLGTRANHNADGIILVDRFHKYDRMHAVLIKQAIPSWRVVNFAMGGHAATNALRTAKMIGNLDDVLLGDSVSVPQLIKMHKSSRRKSYTYWMRLAQHAAMRRPAFARKMMDRAISLKPTDPLRKYELGLAVACSGMKSGLGLIKEAILEHSSAPISWRFKLLVLECASILRFPIKGKAMD